MAKERRPGSLSSSRPATCTVRQQDSGFRASGKLGHAAAPIGRVISSPGPWSNGHGSGRLAGCARSRGRLGALVGNSPILRKSPSLPVACRRVAADTTASVLAEARRPPNPVRGRRICQSRLPAKAVRPMTSLGTVGGSSWTTARTS